MSKNANGEGSIYKRMRDGKLIRFEGAITYMGEDGKTKRHTVYGRTRQDVRDKLKKRGSGSTPAHRCGTLRARSPTGWRSGG